MKEPLIIEKLIIMDNLSIGYNGKPILSGITLSIERNSFTAILGVNGSGKSTLLKTLLGLLPPVGGRIHTTPQPNGTALVFGYVPQTNVFDPIYPLTGYDVALMGTYGRVRPGRFVKREEKKFTQECLGMAGANEFAQKRFSELSGGQKQRILIARALTMRPDILVLDEPTSGVDIAATQAVLESISKIHKEKCISVLMVTHDLGAVHRYANQVLWIHQGKTIYGSSDELLAPERMAEILDVEIG